MHKKLLFLSALVLASASYADPTTLGPELLVTETSLEARDAAQSKLPNNGDGVIRWRALTIDWEKLFVGSERVKLTKTSIEQRLPQFSLQLFPNKRINLKTQSIRENKSGSISILTKIQGEYLSNANLLVEPNGNIYGTIHAQGGYYRIKPVNNRLGHHVVYQLDNSERILKDKEVKSKKKVDQKPLQ